MVEEALYDSAAVARVQHPDRVPIKLVKQMPEPDHPALRAIGEQTGVSGSVAVFGGATTIL